MSLCRFGPWGSNQAINDRRQLRCAAKHCGPTARKLCWAASGWNGDDVQYPAWLPASRPNSPPLPHKWRGDGAKSRPDRHPPCRLHTYCFIDAPRSLAAIRNWKTKRRNTSAPGMGPPKPRSLPTNGGKRIFLVAPMHAAKSSVGPFEWHSSRIGSNDRS